MPPHTISVTRPGPYGNPYYPGCGLGFGNIVEPDARMVNWPLETKADMVRHFREYMRLMQLHEPRRVFERFVLPLRGRNLACWCRLCPSHRDGKPLGLACSDCDPCHSDVIGPIVNSDTRRNVA
jgi:hypothetical protein